jgi:hypothetical protein
MAQMTPQRELVATLGSGTHRGSVNDRESDNNLAKIIRSLAVDTINNNDDIPTLTPGTESPEMMVTPPGISTFTMFSECERQSNKITIKPVTERPRVQGKDNTAPSGALQTFSCAEPQFAQQTPRRAVSFTTAHAFSRFASKDRRRPSRILPLTPIEMSKLGRIPTRSLISKRKSTRNSAGRMGLKAKPLVWRMSSPPKTSELPPELKPSFSRRDRVKERLKHMDMVQVDCADFDPRGLHLAPASSIVNTPNVFYREPTSVRIETPPTPAGSSTPLRNSTSRHATPLRSAALSSTWPSNSLRRARFSENDTLSMNEKHFSLSPSPTAQCIPRRRTVLVDRPPGDTTLIPKERYPAYIPGPIQLEEKISVTPRRTSVADAEHVDNGTAPQANRFSDLVALGGITMYFEAFGIASEASEACLDKYWLRDRIISRPGSSTSAKGTPRGVVAVLPPPVPSPLSGSLSTTFKGTLPTQKALGDGEILVPATSAGTAGRRKPLLRQLLKSSRKSS